MRKDDAGTGQYFRSSDRIFCTNGEWFFETREDDHGPYPTREAAEYELSLYVKEMRALSAANKPPVQEMAKHSGRFRDLKVSDLQLVEKDELPPSTS